MHLSFQLRDGDCHPSRLCKWCAACNDVMQRRVWCLNSRSPEMTTPDEPASAAATEFSSFLLTTVLNTRKPIPCSRLRVLSVW
jgi:hypothetical protein